MQTESSPSKLREPCKKKSSHDIIPVLNAVPLPKLQFNVKSIIMEESSSAVSETPMARPDNIKVEALKPSAFKDIQESSEETETVVTSPAKRMSTVTLEKSVSSIDPPYKKLSTT